MIKLGTGSYIAGRPTVLWNKYGTNVTVGNYTSIARCVTFFMGGHHPTNHVTTRNLTRHPGLTRGDIRIGNDCWVGHGAVLMDGVTVGDGAVVGAYAVVAKDVPPYAIVVGNPARVVRYRFPPDVVARLLEIRWWDWRWRRIRSLRLLLNSDRIEEFIAVAEAQQR